MFFVLFVCWFVVVVAVFVVVVVVVCLFFVFVFFSIGVRGCRRKG